MAYGPIELVVIHFPGNEFKGEILPALDRLVSGGIIRIVDIAFVIKDADGNIAALEVNDLPPAFEPLVAEHGGLISDEDFIAFGEQLEPNSSAALMMFENTWASDFVQAVFNANGEFVMNERIPRVVIEELVSTLAAD